MSTASIFFDLSSFLSLPFLALPSSIPSFLSRFASLDATFPVLVDLFFRSAEILSFSDDFLVCEVCLDAGFFDVSSLVVDFDFDPAFVFLSKLFL